MATDLKAKSQVKYEQFVDKQIAQVSKRIHFLEVGKALLLLLVVTLAYALAMALFDLSVGKDAGSWTSAVRLTGLGIYLCLALVLAVVVLVRLSRRINPYYAARQIEETIPDAKNSVVNWLDLRQSKLPPVIRNALGLRAAKDLKTTDPEKAVDARGTWVLTGVLAGLLIGLMILFLLGPNRFGSLMRRAFFPLDGATLGSRTEITLLKPAGNLTVSLQQKVDFQAQITGAVPRVNSPQAPRLQYRYNQEDAWVRLPLEEDMDGNWSTSLQPEQVHDGFWYKVTAGDAETREYQVKVRALPQVEKFEISYHYRPYFRVADFTVVFPNQHAVFPVIKAHRGTEVTLLVRTPRPLQQARVELDQEGVQKTLLGEINSDQPESFQVKFHLEKPGQFRVYFTSRDGEENSDRSPYQIEMVSDLVPSVVLKKPGQDVSLPANGTLEVEGFASDDFGIKELALYLKVLQPAGQPALQPRIYRTEKPLQFPDGSYPDRLEYKDFLALDQLKTEQGQPFPLAKGTILEYWLQARDNSDYPAKNGNLGKSPSFKINILDPQDQKKAQDEQQKAKNEQQKHEKKQDQDLKKQQEERNQKNSGDQPKSPEQQKEEKDLKDKADRLKKAVEDEEKAKKDQAQKEKGEAKGNDGPKGETKPESAESPQTQPKDQNQQPPASEKTGQKKDKGQEGPMKGDPQSGQAKDAGPKEKNPQPNSNQAKDQGKGQPPSEAGKGKEEPKGSETPKRDDPPGTAKKNTPEKQPGDSQKPGPEKGQEPPAQAKDTPPQSGNQSGQAKEQKPGKEGPTPQAKDDKNASGNQTPDQAKGDAKTLPKEQVNQAQEKKAPGDKGDQGQAKEAGPAPEENPAQAKGTESPNQEKSSTKPAGEKVQKSPSQGQARDAKNTKETPGQTKSADPKDTQKAAQTKEAAPRDEKINENARTQEPSLDDIQKLKDQIKKEGPGGDDAARELSKAAKEAKDPAVRKAAEEALKESGRTPEQIAKNAVEKKESSKEPNKGMGNPPEQKTETKQPKEPGKDPSFKSGPGGKGVTDDPKAQDPDAEASKRAGNLTLEDLKKKVTPEILKKAGLNEKEWQEFLQKSQEYEASLNRQKNQQAKNNPQNLLGDPSKIPNLSPRLLEGNKAPTTPLEAGRGLPPPEFREQYYRWTTQPQQSPNKK